MRLRAVRKRFFPSAARLSVALALASVSCSDHDEQGVEATHGVPDWCQGCLVNLVRSKSIGSPSDSVGIQFFSHLAVSPSGHYMVAPIGDGAQIGEYDTHGRLLRVIGGAGGAPGEYDLIRDVALGVADTAYILDQHRLTILTPEREVLRSVAVPAGVRASRIALLAGDLIVLNDYGQGSKEFVIVDHMIELVARFASGLRHAAYDPEHMQFVLTRSTVDSGFWAAKVVAPFTAAHFASDGRELQRHSIEESWLESTADRMDGPQDPRTVRPAPRIGDIWFDGSVLWLSVLVPDAHWSPRPSVGVGGSESSPMPSPGEWEHIYDTVIAVMDTETGAIATTLRRDEVFAEFAGAGQIWALEEAEDGTLTIGVFQLELIK